MRAIEGLAQRRLRRGEAEFLFAVLVDDPPREAGAQNAYPVEDDQRMLPFDDRGRLHLPGGFEFLDQLSVAARVAETYAAIGRGPSSAMSQASSEDRPGPSGFLRLPLTPGLGRH